MKENYLCRYKLRGLWCPFARTRDGANRGIFGGCELPTETMCVGQHCAAWIVSPEDDGLRNLGRRGLVPGLEVFHLGGYASRPMELRLNSGAERSRLPA